MVSFNIRNLKISLLNVDFKLWWSQISAWIINCPSYQSIGEQGLNIIPYILFLVLLAYYILLTGFHQLYIARVDASLRNKWSKLSLLSCKYVWGTRTYAFLQYHIVVQIGLMPVTFSHILNDPYYYGVRSYMSFEKSI